MLSEHVMNVIPDYSDLAYLVGCHLQRSVPQLSVSESTHVKQL